MRHLEGGTCLTVSQDQGFIAQVQPVVGGLKGEVKG